MRLKHLKKIRALFGGINFAGEGGEGQSRFERLWRPLFGYCVSLTWVAYIFTICWTALGKNACTADVIDALMEAASLWSMALGVFGVSVVRGASGKQNAVSKNETEINQQHKL